MVMNLAVEVKKAETLPPFTPEQKKTQDRVKVALYVGLVIMAIGIIGSIAYAATAAITHAPRLMNAAPIAYGAGSLAMAGGLTIAGLPALLYLNKHKQFRDNGELVDTTRRV